MVTRQQALAFSVHCRGYCGTLTNSSSVEIAKLYLNSNAESVSKQNALENVQK